MTGKIDRQADGCWRWTGNLNHQGYGPHRRIYRLFMGPIPEGLTLDHLCNNRACVNPDHLEPVTLAENSRRSWERTPHRPKRELVTRDDGSIDVEEGDPVGVVEVAARLGVQRATVDQWRQRDLGFPEPRWTVGGRPAWQWEDVQRWYERRKSAPPQNG